MDSQNVNFDGSRIDKAVGFWQKNRSWLIPLISIFGGLVGGNADRLGSFVPQALVSKPVECQCQKVDNPYSNRPDEPTKTGAVEVRVDRQYNK